MILKKFWSNLEIAESFHQSQTLIFASLFVALIFNFVPQDLILSVLSLSAGCRRNSLAEKAAITGWIFGLWSLGKAQQALSLAIHKALWAFFEPPRFNFQPGA